MQGHFAEHLKFRDILLKYRPAHILELGALGGMNTVQLLSLALDIPNLHVTVVTDGKSDQPKPTDPHLTFIWGISYVEMAKMPDASVGCAVIDTDHNYWTLKQELTQCARLLCAPGLILMHDTVTFGHATGKMTHYAADVPYPLAEIEAAEGMGFGMKDAIQEFLDANPSYVVEAESLEHHGAMALRRVD